MNNVDLIIGDDREHIARISYGKDSLKMLDVIHTRGLRLDRITTTDVWATDTVPAWLPPMDAFKARMDEWIWTNYRIEVEHLCARNKDGSKKTYEQMFYHIPVRRSQTVQVERERERETGGAPGWRVQGTITGFPPNTGYNYCQKLKIVHTPYQGLASLKRNTYMVSETQIKSGDPKDSLLKSPVGARNSRSTMSEPLFRQPATTGEKKYRGIPRHCSRRTGSLWPVK